MHSLDTVHDKPNVFQSFLLASNHTFAGQFFLQSSLSAQILCRMISRLGRLNQQRLVTSFIYTLVHLSTMITILMIITILHPHPHHPHHHHHHLLHPSLSPSSGSVSVSSSDSVPLSSPSSSPTTPAWTSHVTT